MSILDDFLDGEVFQFHVSVLGRNSAFLGIAGRGVVVALRFLAAAAAAAAAAATPSSFAKS